MKLFRWLEIIQGYGALVIVDWQKYSCNDTHCRVKPMGSDKLETYFYDPCSNQPSYEGSRLTMAKIANRNNICRLNSVAELEIISLSTNSNCIENQCSTGKNHTYFSTTLHIHRCGNRLTAGGKPHLTPNYTYMDVETGWLPEENHTWPQL